MNSMVLMLIDQVPSCFVCAIENLFIVLAMTEAVSLHTYLRKYSFTHPEIVVAYGATKAYKHQYLKLDRRDHKPLFPNDLSPSGLHPHATRFRCSALNPPLPSHSLSSAQPFPSSSPSGTSLLRAS
jgi:hypothetical protein